jgi:GntR family transcriptional regulator, histidine utilization repressor
MDRPAGWQSIRAEALRRMHVGDWPPGARIPDEAELAAEFGCARATVNRALRDLAEAGLLERRRKGGTRVPLTPVRKATFEIAIIRSDVEGRGQHYGYRLLEDALAPPPAEVRAALDWPEFNRPEGAPMRRVLALHLADGSPFCLEDRWLNPRIAPPDVRFDALSANEWLVRTVPWTSGRIGFLAREAGAQAARWLGCPVGAALLAVERITRTERAPITFVRLSYAPGHRVDATL